MARLTYRSLLLSTVLSIAQVTSCSAALEEQRQEELESITGDAAEQEVIREACIGWIGECFQGQIDSQIENSRLRGESPQMVEELSRHIVIPEIARGHEVVYRQFLRGKVVYKPNKNNDEGREEFSISSLPNPLRGTFDIRKCGDSDKHLSISTGFRTEKNPSNASKYEVWIVPQFVLQKDPRAKALYDFLQKQPEHRGKPFAVLFTWGGWADDDCDHGVTGVVGSEFDSLFAISEAISAHGEAALWTQDREEMWHISWV